VISVGDLVRISTQSYSYEKGLASGIVLEVDNMGTPVDVNYIRVYMSENVLWFREDELIRVTGCETK
jgi:UDP-N-acetylglucosamine pyrophosphorylase